MSAADEDSEQQCSHVARKREEPVLAFSKKLCASALQSCREPCEWNEQESPVKEHSGLDSFFFKALHSSPGAEQHSLHDA